MLRVKSRTTSCAKVGSAAWMAGGGGGDGDCDGGMHSLLPLVGDACLLLLLGGCTDPQE